MAFWISVRVSPTFLAQVWEVFIICFFYAAKAVACKLRRASLNFSKILIGMARNAVKAGIFEILEIRRGELNRAVCL